MVRTGTVLGVDWTFTPDEVSRAFGMDPTVNQNRHHLWHDYGLVEFFWERTADGRWRGTHFTVQVHRLDAIAYGILAADLTVPLVAVESSDKDLRAYWQPDSTALVLVVAENPSLASNASSLPPGHVYQITAPHHAAGVDLRGVASTGMGGQARHLRTLGEPGRRAWLDRQPADAIASGNWWAHLFLHVDERVRQQPLRRAGWVELRLWLLDRAAAAGVLNQRELAEQRARFVGGLYACDIAAGLDSVLPTVDELIAACLAAIPVTPDEVMAIEDWRAEPRDTMRRLRQAKNLINAAESLPRGDDPEVAAELDLWVRRKPRLA